MSHIGLKYQGRILVQVTIYRIGFGLVEIYRNLYENTALIVYGGFIYTSINPLTAKIIQFEFSPT